MAVTTAVRSQVRTLLESAPAYRALPADARRRIAQDTVRVATYMADPGGLAACASRSVRRGRGAAFTVDLTPSLHQGSTAWDALARQVDFPDFVSTLIQGVFNAIVQTSIEQMQAYADLIAQVSSSVDQFRQDRLDDRCARDTLFTEFPELFARPTGRPTGLAWRIGADAAARQRLLASLAGPGRRADLRAIVAATRCRLARQRQQTLATTVLMGINRIVTGGGRIGTSITFVSLPR